MKSFILALAVCTSGILAAQQYKVITIVESIVPGGLGRSRIIDSQGTADINALTTQRVGKISKQSDVDREDVKESGENMKETKLVNFYSMAGINFGNIASNDAVITAKVNALAAEGWTIAHVSSACESDAGEKDNRGIFITRIFFVKK